jgi:hypothetical protein
MAKPNGLSKIGGRLLKDPQVYKKLREDSRIYSMVVLPGGGGDINKAFRQRGWPIKFGPLGRITETLEQRQVCRDILEVNQAIVQDQLDELGIEARVVIPVRYIGDVLCLENGDVTVISSYNGFDRIWVYTLQGIAEKKRLWLAQIAKCFSHIQEGELDKIEVVGF